MSDSSTMKFGAKTWLLILICLASIGVSFQAYYAGNKAFGDGTGEKVHTHYNNYLIFKNSFYHLVEDKDLYIHYPSEQHDLYKYSPAFSLAMGALAWMPDLLGLCLWNLLNALVLFFALWSLPWSSRAKMWAMLFVLIELITSLQSSQSNGLMAGLMIYAYTFLERGKISAAVLSVLAAVFIKPFALVGFAIFLFYKGIPRMVGYGLLWTVVLLLVPMVVVSGGQLHFLYGSWLDMMQADHAASYGYSVMGWLYSWFGLEPSKGLVVLAGVALFCLPYIRRGYWREEWYRMLFLASVLIWVVIFNHKAESPTFVIAAAGVAIWFYYSRRSRLDWLLLGLVFVFTILSPTDLFPRQLRKEWVQPYALKGVACIFVWAKLVYDQMTLPADFDAKL